MDWSNATLHLRKPSCPVVPGLGETDRVRCLDRRGAPVAHVTGDAPGWETLAPCRDGRIAKRTEACEHCPVRLLPDDVVPIEVEARSTGLRVEVASRRPTALSAAYRRLRVDGQEPRVLRGGRGGESPGAYVHLGDLSARQREALAAAKRIGYFEVGSGGVDALAQEMGCGRSAAHEHLRRAMARLLDAVA